MFLRQRYKLLTLKKVPNEVNLMLKLNNSSRQMEFTDEGESPIYEEGETMTMGVKVTVEDAADIAKLVTEIDLNQEKGVEALYFILSAIQRGKSADEAIDYCVQSLTPKKRKKK